MYHSKKIGVFISHIMGEYQRNLCQGIIDKALEFGYASEIFTSMDGENLGDYTIGEASIQSIPNYDEFCGVIFASETYPLPELRDQIYQTLTEKCSCPVIELAVANQHFPFIALENNSTTKQLTRHLIREHHYERICYLGCSAESYFSDARESYFREEMKECGLSVGDKDIYHAVYTRESVSAALSFFLSDEKKPEAVICYNDRMALLFMREAFLAGYRIPEDFAVTGCDFSKEGQNISPVLTTVTFPSYELGTAAVENLMQSINEKSIPKNRQVTANIMLGNSCGCRTKKDPNAIFFQQDLIDRISSLESSILGSMRMSAAFQGVTDIDDAMDLLESYVSKIEHCREFYLCLYSDWDSVSHHILELTDHVEDTFADSDEILLKLAIRDGKRLPECSFTKTSLLPEHICRHSDSAYIYTPLFFKDKAFGYIALAYENNRIDYNFKLVHWFMNINQMLMRICDAKRTSILVNHLEDIYTKDALTGLYNKHGYLHYETLLLSEAIATESRITCFLFDLDGLKYINDTFGHSEGDFAIQVIGHALSSMIRPEDVCARFSGDEFYLLTKDYSEEEAEELLNRIYKYLSNYNKLSNKKYRISASGGYASAIAAKGFSKEDVEKLFALADRNMYEQKQEHHAKMQAH